MTLRAGIIKRCLEDSKLKNKVCKHIEKAILSSMPEIK